MNKGCDNTRYLIIIYIRRVIKVKINVMEVY